jgi:hypothetical protein
LADAPIDGSLNPVAPTSWAKLPFPSDVVLAGTILRAACAWVDDAGLEAVATEPRRAACVRARPRS